jgi:hypothetical protein
MYTKLATRLPAALFNVSAGSQIARQGDPGDPDKRYTHLLMIPTNVLHVSEGSHTPS